MTQKSTKSRKNTVIRHWDGGKKFWMSPTEFTGVVVGKGDTASEYFISDGVIGPGGFIPDHFHKWQDQTFHILEDRLEAMIGDEVATVGPGETIHCPRGVSHYMRNVGDSEARILSDIFPGDWVEDFMAETSRQNHSANAISD